MKKSNFDFGSHWSNPKRFVRVQESAERTSVDAGIDMGFRMAHDSSDRGYIGSRWFAGPNQAHTGGHMSKIRGSYYVDGRRSLTLTTSDDDKLMDVGFRLVHDASSRVNRGGCWYYAAGDARAAIRLGYDPGRRGDDLGLRLCVDWRKE